MSGTTYPGSTDAITISLVGRRAQGRQGAAQADRRSASDRRSHIGQMRRDAGASRLRRPRPTVRNTPTRLHLVICCPVVAVLDIKARNSSMTNTKFGDEP